MKLEKTISVILILAFLVIALHIKPMYQAQKQSSYQAIKPIDLSGVPASEVFSEEVDTIFYDELGIKNVRFKQTF